MKVLIHQPEYLPYIGFWNRLLQTDVYVVLDTATFQKHGFMHRNKIKTASGPEWMTVPLQNKSSFTPIKDLLIDNTKGWKQGHISLLKQWYVDAPYSKEVLQIVEGVYAKDWERMVDVSHAMFSEVSQFLNITPRVIKSSELQAKGKATDLLVEICKELGADTYISGPGQRDGKKAYMEPEKFEQAGIKLQIHEFEHPTYNQQYMEQGFLPYMCILDLLFNEGLKSSDIVRGTI